MGIVVNFSWRTGYVKITPTLCVIHHPKTARGGTGARWRMLRRLLNAHAEFRPSTEPGQSLALAEAAAREGFPTVVAAGGDGTVHEVANGILRSGCPTALGVMPLGSGDDYATMIGASRSPNLAVTCLLSPETWAVDVGEVTDDQGHSRFFLNTLGFGLSGAVTWEASQLKRQWRGLRGLPLYGLAAVHAVWSSFTPVRTTLTLDGATQEADILYMAIALGRCEGGGFVVAPNARLDDGWFDYLQAGRLTRLQALGYIPRLALGWLPEGKTAIRQGQCRTVELHTTAPFYSHTDGEQLTTPPQGVHSLRIRLLPGALRIRGTAPPVR